MSNVTLTIGGREHVVACDAGEEAHIVELGQMIDAKLASIPSGAPTSDTRALLFAALLLADELYEHKHAGSAQSGAGELPLIDGTGVPHDQLEALAARLEALAAMLEGSA